MIFVTVGTHEQPFNRLIQAVDELCGSGIITEPVIMQTGFSTYQPKNCGWKSFFSYEDMEKNVLNSRITITHGGPSSFMIPLHAGKVPIVVPRQASFNEHVNNHQVEFVEAVAKRLGSIIPVFNIDDLAEIITSYDAILVSSRNGINRMNTNNDRFSNEFEHIVKSMFAEKE